MEAAEFDAWYAASFPRLTRQLYAMIGDRTEAHDCVQEAFVRAWAARRSLDGHRHPDAWIRTTAHRLAISRWRRRQHAKKAPDRALNAAHVVAEPSPDHVALVAALATLPFEQRQALVLHHLADLPVAEVAAEIGAPEGTVKARLSRGRTALAALLTDGSTHA